MAKDDNKTIPKLPRHNLKGQKDPWDAQLCSICGALLKWVYDKNKRKHCEECEKDTGEK